MREKAIACGLVGPQEIINEVQCFDSGPVTGHRFWNGQSQSRHVCMHFDEAQKSAGVEMGCQ